MCHLILWQMSSDLSIHSTPSSNSTQVIMQQNEDLQTSRSTLNAEDGEDHCAELACPSSLYVPDAAHPYIQ